MDDDDAIRWATRLDGAPLAPDEQRALDAWLAEDERRHGALLRAEAALAYLDRGRALVAPQAEAHPVAEEEEDARVVRASFGRRAFLAGASAAGLSAAGLAGFVFWTRRPEQYATAVGEVRRVPLADGSVAAINTASRLAVAIGDNRRRVTIEDGEAWFQVAHDKKRPFVVEAGDVRVQAVGTAFSVRRRPDGADVLVTEGVVEAWVVGRESQRTRIAAGGKSFIADAAPAIEVVKAPEEVERQLAWRTGELALNGETLSYAVAELNRYNTRKLVVDDPALGREPLVGYFRTNEPENFGRAVAKMTGAQVEEDADTIRLVRAP